MGAYYFLSCLLPPLPSQLGDKLAMPFSEMARIVRRHIDPSDDVLLRALLSIIDAANLESIDQGRDFFLEGGTISREEMEAKQNLPDFIRVFLDEKERGIRHAYIHNRLWELCYGTLMALAEGAGCRYLIDYMVWEIELRNHLAALRLRERGGNIADHTIMSGIRSFDFAALMAQIEGQKSPLEAERIIDRERLKRIYHCQGIDPFSLDSMLAYLSSAMIYSRWEHMQTPYDIHKFLYNGG